MAAFYACIMFLYSDDEMHVESQRSLLRTINLTIASDILLVSNYHLFNIFSCPNSFSHLWSTLVVNCGMHKKDHKKWNLLPKCLSQTVP